MKRFTLILAGIVLLAVVGGVILTRLQIGPGDEVVLSKAKQEFIWDAEHVTFEIERYFGQPLADAMRKQYVKNVRNLFPEGFRGEIFSRTHAHERAYESLREVKWLRDEETVSEVDADALLADLLNLLEPFEKVTYSGVRVLQIDSVDRDAGIWTTDLMLYAQGDLAAGGRGKMTSYATAVFNVKKDSLLHQGKSIQSLELESEKLITSAQSLMEEVTQEFGLSGLIEDNWDEDVAGKVVRFQTAVADFDRDGYPDIAVADYNGQPMLLRSQGGQGYIDQGRILGLRPWDPILEPKNALVAWIDFDNDGFQDLIMGPKVYRNVSGLRFEEMTEQSGLTFKHDPYGCAVADYDADGWLDLYVVYEQPERPPAKVAWVGDDQGGEPNELWRNEGNGVFRNVTEEANASGGSRSSFAASWFFYDDDHYPDLYIANDFAINVVLRNRGDGTFENVTEASGAAGFATSMGVATGDLNNDGSTEIYVANMFSKMGRRIISHVDAGDYPEGVYRQIVGSCAGNRLYYRGEDGTYHDLSSELGVNQVGWAFAPAMADFDGNGLLDLYATTGFMSVDRRKPDG